MKITPRDVDAIAKDAMSTHKMSLLGARRLAKKFHPKVEDSAVKVLNQYKEEEVRAWWKEQRRKHVEIAMVYRAIVKSTARKQGRMKISRLLK